MHIRYLYHLPFYYPAVKRQCIIVGTLIDKLIGYFQGFCQNVLGLIRLGLLDEQSHPSLQSKDDLTWKDFMCDLMNLKRDVSTNALRSAIHQKLQNESQVRTIEQYEQTCL